ncbi:MAG TPA: P63C domain-containing protein [Ktedonobacteraceae bacterium]|nr:P63C domain-containing protein [Ktedonobacteraceae bacterium]
MTESQLKATHKGNLHIAHVDIRCFVLEDKRRVISGRSLTQAIGMRGRGQGASRIPLHPALKNFISSELALAIENPIQFKSNGLSSTGFEATILRQVCEAVLRARDAGTLKTEQEQRYAKAADTLIRAFATVGIIALVDEATGYQAERDKDELQTILSAYIAPELMPWTRRFPPEFYEQMFRLWGWQYRPLSIKRPRHAGKLTSQLIYEKLPPGVLEELRRKNPPDETGRRKHKHHQFLTDDVGNPHLEKQLAIVTTLMRISPNWRVFMAHFSRAFPSDVEQLTFDFEGEEEEREQ